MHFSGIGGMPRRIPDYPDIFALLNYIETVGAVVSIGSAFYFFYLMILSFDNFRLKEKREREGRELDLYLIFDGILVKENHPRSQLKKFKRDKYSFFYRALV